MPDTTHVVQFLGGPLCGAIQGFPRGEWPPGEWEIVKPAESAEQLMVRDLTDPHSTVPLVSGYYRFAPCCEGGDGMYHWQGWDSVPSGKEAQR